MNRGATVSLAVLNLLLAGVLLWQWVDPQGGLRNVHWQPPAPIKPALDSPSAASAALRDAGTGRVVALLERPVFSPTRRPPLPPVVAKVVPPPPPDPLNTLHLYGMFSGSEGGGVIARVDGKMRRVKISEPVGDWKLKAISGSNAVFGRGSEIRTVPLVQVKQAGSAGSVSSTTAPPAPPAPTTAAAPPAQPPATAATTPTPGTAPSPFVIGGSRR